MTASARPLTVGDKVKKICDDLLRYRPLRQRPQVEALVEGDNLYYGGKITQIHPDNTATIEYDDGECLK